MKKAALLFLALVFVLAGSLTALYFRFYGGSGSLVIPDFPQPQLSRSYVPPSEVHSSRITVPVTLAMSDLQALANRNLIWQYEGHSELRDRTVRGRLDYLIRREDDARVTEENGRIKISLPISFRVRFSGNVSAAIARVPLSVQTEGDLDIFITIRPSIEHDWSIKTETEVDFAWRRSPYINVAGFRVGLRRETDNFLRNAIRDNLFRVDEIVNKEIRLRDIMQRQWDNLAVPIRAADGVFLHFDPRGIAVSPLEVTPDNITLRANVETGISLSVGLGNTVRENGQARGTELPPLGLYVPSDDSLSLNVRALVNYNSLEQEAMNALSRASLDLGVASVSVQSLRLMGSGENLVAAFELSTGSSSGTIHALGEPYFNEDTRILSVRNFDLDAGTRAGLVGTAAWLLRPALVSFLNGNLEWALGSQIDKLTDDARRIITSLNISNEFKLRGTLESAHFEGLRVTEQGIEIGLSIDGSLALTYIPVF